MNAPAVHHNLDRRAAPAERAPRIFVLPPGLRPLLLTIDALVPGAINAAARAMRPHHAHKQIVPAFLLWLLLDDDYGVIRLTRREDVRHALTCTCDALLQQMEGHAPPPELRRMAELRAEAAQGAAWRDMKFRSGAPGEARVEWMVATVVLRSIDRYGVSLDEALHSAMVAWGAPVPGRREVASPTLARAALAYLLDLLAEAPQHSGVPA